MKWAATICAAVFAVSAQPLLAADDVDVNVTGVIRPASCAMSVGNGGGFDHGEINPSLIGSNPGGNYLGGLETPFSIECASAARWALRGVDNRPGTTLGGSTQSYFGLGTTAGGVRIGEYRLTVAEGVGDGDAVVATRSTDNGASWSRPATGVVSPQGGNALLGFNVDGADREGPKAIHSFAGKLRVATYINAASAFDLAEDVELDGSATLQLYLL